VITSVTGVVRVRLPLTPLIVRAKFPVGVVELVVTENVEELPDPGLGLKLALDPCGKLLTLRVTAPLKPPTLLMSIA
jgi:hypothetical protein